MIWMLGLLGKMMILEDINDIISYNLDDGMGRLGAVEDSLWLWKNHRKTIGTP